MKNRFISPSKASLVRFEAVNSGIHLKASSEINPRIGSFALKMLSSKQLSQAGYL